MVQKGSGRTIFGEFLQKNRIKKGWSLIEMEKETGINASYLHRLEKGQRRNPTVSIIDAISKAFHVEIVTLVELVLIDQEEEVHGI